MVDREELQEIESMGEEEEQEERQEEKGSGSVVPLIQAALCVLILLALVCLKFTNEEIYGKAAEWYRQEASLEIELPRFSGPEEAGEASQTAEKLSMGTLWEV